MIYIGIDPGINGGIAALEADGFVASVAPMPSSDRDMLTKLNEMKIGSSRAMLEFVRSSPQMGVASSFKFGCGYGGLRMALAAYEIPFDEVTPLKWQNAMGCRTRGDKNVSKRRAQELFPSLKVTHALADALLLAEYCRRLHRLKGVA